MVLVTTGLLDPLETVGGSAFDGTVDGDVWVLVDVDDLPVDLPVEKAVDSVERAELVADSDVVDEPVVDDEGNVVLVVKTVGSIFEVDWEVDDFSVCFAGIDSILEVRILNVDDAPSEDAFVDNDVNKVRLDFTGGVSFVVDVLDSWFGVTVSFVVVFVVTICFWVVNFVGWGCLVVVVLGGCCVEVVSCTITDVEAACLLVGLVFWDVVLGFSVLDIVVHVVGVIVVITVDDVWIDLSVVGFTETDVTLDSGIVVCFDVVVCFGNGVCFGAIVSFVAVVCFDGGIELVRKLGFVLSFGVVFPMEVVKVISAVCVFPGFVILVCGWDMVFVVFDFNDIVLAFVTKSILLLVVEKKGDDSFDETGLPGVDIKGVGLVDMSVVDIVVDDVEEAKDDEGEDDDVIEAGNEETDAVNDRCTNEDDFSKNDDDLVIGVLDADSDEWFDDWMGEVGVPCDKLWSDGGDEVDDNFLSAFPLKWLSKFERLLNLICKVMK